MTPALRSLATRTAEYVGCSLLTVAVGGVLPLFWHNQNTKFLHGLAAAGWDFLLRDPALATADPFPAFSLLVAAVARADAPALFVVLYGALAGAYLTGLLWIAAALHPVFREARGRRLLAGALLLLHSVGLAALSRPALGVDLRGVLTEGIGGFYLLGGYLQPSVFGALLVVAIALLLHRRRVAAAAAIGIAGAIHPYYLLAGALLLLGEGYAAGRRGEGLRGPLLSGLLAAAVAAPAVYALAVGLAPDSAETAAAAERILATVRQPHHALAERFLARGESWAAVAIVVAGLAAVRRRRLLPVLAVPFLYGVAGTGLYLATGSYAVANSFPWRIMALLVPVATTVLAARGLDGLLSGPRGPAVRRALPPVLLALVGIAAVHGVFWSATAETRRPSAVLSGAVAHVRATADERDLYLIPPLFLFQDFRLAARVPVYVDWKSAPRRDVDVIEWFRRVQAARRVYRGARIADCRALRALAGAAGVTHAVGTAESRLCPGWARVYADRRYAVFRRL